MINGKIEEYVAGRSRGETMTEASFFITKEMVRRWCSSNAMYQRGLSYYQHGRVSQLTFHPSQRGWHAVVTGSEDYDVEISMGSREIDAWCECPAYDTYRSCKHIVAVLLEIQERQDEEEIVVSPTLKTQKDSRNQRINSWDDYKYEQAAQLIDTVMNRVKPASEEKQIHGKQPVAIEYICKVHMPVSTGPRLLAIELKVGTQRTYVVKSMEEFLRSVIEGDSYYFTVKFSFDPSEHYLLAEDLEVMKLLKEIISNEAFFRVQQSYYWGSRNDRSLLIPPMIVDRLFSKLNGRAISFEEYTDVRFEIDPKENQLPLTFRLEKGSGEEFKLDVSDLKTIVFFESYGWFFQDGVFYKLSDAQKDMMSKFVPMLRSMEGASLPVAQKQMETFISYVVPGLKKIGQVEVAEQVSDRIISPPLQAKMFIDHEEERMFAKIEYHYGDIVIDPFRPDASNSFSRGIILMREMEKEQGIMKIFESTSFKYNGKECYIEGDQEIYDFLFATLPSLAPQVELYMSGSAQSLTLFRHHAPSTKIDVDSGGNLLEISFDMDEINQEEVKEILQSVVEKKSYHRLSNGAFVSLENDAFRTITHLFTELQVNKSQIKEGTLQLPVYRSLQIDGIISKTDTYSASLGKNFRRLIQELKNPDMIDFSVPASLHAKLRDYQHFGFQWLKTLAHYRLGGILADDMGLGKTLQTIAYLLSEKEEAKEGKRKSLIVVPASLVYNWKLECEKFAPDLEVAVVYGTREERMECFRKGEPDLFITSYPLLRQDFELYEEMEFDSLILDEAQAIKNHLTKTANAVKTIKAKKRFALSGTPIENSLDELWSIFDTILPGFFYNHRMFKDLEQEKIAQMVRPFILRRLKQDVLKELPEKIETIHQSELTKQQKELYVGYLGRIQQETRDSLQAGGFQKNRMKILAGLTRLRQLCCHPALFLENYKDKSGKMEQLMELIENALENKKRILVFSQFTSMLAIIREELAQKNIGYFYLSGQTPSRERIDMTERFNQGENDLFLISLKAGGTGLNLTGADTVILYDLWWNPAVEEQAAGRAHRIGQKNSVQVMRLIARGTIEEKIYEMQQKKKELIEQVIQPGETMLSSLSEAEICDILGI